MRIILLVAASLLSAALIVPTVTQTDPSPLELQA